MFGTRMDRKSLDLLTKSQVQDVMIEAYEAAIEGIKDLIQPWDEEDTDNIVNVFTKVMLRETSLIRKENSEIIRKYRQLVLAGINVHEADND